MKKNQKEERSSSKTLLLFCLVVGLLIVGSVVVKVVKTVQQSQFDGKHRFTLWYQWSREQSSIYSLDPQSKSLTVLYLESPSSIRNPQRLLNIPIDGKITSNATKPSENHTYTYFRLLTGFTNQISKVTWYDLVRLLVLAQSVPQKNINEIRVELPEEQLVLDETIGKYFVDALIQEEEADISIENASGISGLGGRVEQYVKRLGGSVVSVTTAREQEEMSKLLYYKEESSTVDKLSQLFGFEEEKMKKRSISDIVLILGKDMEQRKEF